LLSTGEGEKAGLALGVLLGSCSGMKEVDGLRLSAALGLLLSIGEEEKAGLVLGGCSGIKEEDGLRLSTALALEETVEVRMGEKEGRELRVEVGEGREVLVAE
jgi:hypothetical protein